MMVGALLVILLAAVCTAQQATLTFYFDNNFLPVSSAWTKTINANDTTCYNLPTNVRQQPSSFSTKGVDGAVVYSDADCNGQQTTLFAPTSNMGDLWNDRIVSFRAVASINPPNATYDTAAPSYGECNVAVFVDNYIIRVLNATLSPAKIRQKYLAYFSDLNSYYSTHFNIKMNIVYLYLEQNGLFTNTSDGGQLLNLFKNQIVNNLWPGLPDPSTICTYHLLTGRNPTGIAGIAYEDTACEPGYGLAVDGRGQDQGGLVMRRVIHEVTHNFHGSHPDGYTNQNPPYTCSVDDSIGVYRIMKRNSVVPMKFVEAGSRLSECAENSVRNAMSTWSCLYKKNPRNDLPTMQIYEDSNFNGKVVNLRPRYANDSCYDIVGMGISSAKLINNVSGMWVFLNQDCRGSATYWPNSTFPLSYVGDNYNDRIASVRFNLTKSK